MSDNMNMSLLNAIDLTDEQLSQLSYPDVSSIATKVSDFLEQDRQYRQILYYNPVSPIARQAHLSESKTIALFGGNGSSKTDTVLAELVIMMTGIIPMHLKDLPKRKIK